MTEINFEDLSWSQSELVLIPMPDGSWEQTIILKDVRGLPEGIQGFTVYSGNPISYKYNVIGINENLTYPPVEDKFTYAITHEIQHVKNKKRPLIRNLPPVMEEYVTRRISDDLYYEKKGERVDTAGDMLGSNDYNKYALKSMVW